MSEDYEARAHKQIQIESWSNAARTLHLRGSTTGGPFAESHTTNSDRSRASDTYELHGTPTKLQVSPSAAPVRRCECYVRVTLLMDGEPVLRLAAAYLTDSKTISWPPGQFEDFTSDPGLPVMAAGTDPAAGAEISQTIATNVRERLIGLTVTLVNDATVANRQVRLFVDDGANVIWRSQILPAQTASQTNIYHFMRRGQADETAFDADGKIRISIPDLPPLFQGWRFYTSTLNLQAGDNWAAPLIMTERWIEE